MKQCIIRTNAPRHMGVTYAWFYRLKLSLSNYQQKVTEREAFSIKSSKLYFPILYNLLFVITFEPICALKIPTVKSFEIHFSFQPCKNNPFKVRLKFSKRAKFDPLYKVPVLLLFKEIASRLSCKLLQNKRFQASVKQNGDDQNGYLCPTEIGPFSLGSQSAKLSLA